MEVSPGRFVTEQSLKSVGATAAGGSFVTDTGEDRSMSAPALFNFFREAIRDAENA
ncbi:hypothetical protein JCM19992_20410 [Thermostilla marina]